MTERAVPDIMQQRCNHSYLSPLFIRHKSASRRLSFDDLDQLSRGMKDANRMSKTSVGCPREDELGDAELLDPAKTLELRRVEQGPGKLIQWLLGLKYN